MEPEILGEQLGHTGDHVPSTVEFLVYWLCAPEASSLVRAKLAAVGRCTFRPRPRHQSESMLSSRALSRSGSSYTSQPLKEVLEARLRRGTPKRVVHLSASDVQEVGHAHTLSQQFSLTLV